MDLSMIIFTVLAVLALFGTAIALLKRYKRCPSDKLLVVYGKTGGDGTAKVYHGGGKFIYFACASPLLKISFSCITC